MPCSSILSPFFVSIWVISNNCMLKVVSVQQLFYSKWIDITVQRTQAPLPHKIPSHYSCSQTESVIQTHSLACNKELKVIRELMKKEEAWARTVRIKNLSPVCQNDSAFFRSFSHSLTLKYGKELCSPVKSANKNFLLLWQNSRHSNHRPRSRAESVSFDGYHRIRYHWSRRQ